MPTISPRVLCSQRSKTGTAAANAGVDAKAGLLAVASERTAILLSQATLEVVQALDEHNVAITAVRFASRTLSHPAKDALVLATGDSSGQIFIWNA